MIVGGLGQRQQRLHELAGHQARERVRRVRRRRVRVIEHDRLAASASIAGVTPLPPYARRRSARSASMVMSSTSRPRRSMPSWLAVRRRTARRPCSARGAACAFRMRQEPPRQRRGFHDRKARVRRVGERARLQDREHAERERDRPPQPPCAACARRCAIGRNGAAHNAPAARARASSRGTPDTSGPEQHVDDERERRDSRSATPRTRRACRLARARARGTRRTCRKPTSSRQRRRRRPDGRQRQRVHTPAGGQQPRTRQHAARRPNTTDRAEHALRAPREHPRSPGSAAQRRHRRARRAPAYSAGHAASASSA